VFSSFDRRVSTYPTPKTKENACLKRKNDGSVAQERAAFEAGRQLLDHRRAGLKAMESRIREPQAESERKAREIARGLESLVEMA